MNNLIDKGFEKIAEEDNNKKLEEDKKLYELLEKLNKENAYEGIKEMPFLCTNKTPIELELIYNKIKEKTKLPIKTLKDYFEKYFQKINNKEYAEEPSLNNALVKEANLRFEDPTLIKHIYQELDKYHKEDNKEKIAVFLIRASAELLDPEDHCSGALKGKSAAGKDDTIKTVLRHFPDKDSFFLTRGTQSALEEEASQVKCIAFSEANAERDNGANKELTEMFKQFSEGGVHVVRRDMITGEVIHIITEQKTLLYSTTETVSDDELQTRFTVIPIRSNEEKNKIVVKAYLEKISDPKLYSELNYKDNWIKTGITTLDHSLEISVPYATVLTDSFKNEDTEKQSLFDMSKERIKRDVKRLMSLTKSITWLYQKQRIIKEYDGKKYIISEPQDFKLAFYIFIDFFDLTYIGIDYRILDVLKVIKELEGTQSKEIIEKGYDKIKYADYVLRHTVQEKCNISSVNTIKKYVDELKDKGLIEVYYDELIPRGYLIKSKTNYQSAYQEGIRAHHLKAIDTLMKPYFDTLKKDNPTEAKAVYERFTKFNDFMKTFSKDLTPSNLTPSKSEEISPNMEDLRMMILDKPDISLDRLFSLKFSKEQIQSALNQNLFPQTSLDKWKLEGTIYSDKPNHYCLN